MNRGQSEIANMIERTFWIRTTFQNGTAFVIDEGDHQYLVTARHLIESQDRNDSVLVYGEGRGVIVAPVQRIAVGTGDINSGGIDVAVMELSSPISFDSDPLPIGCPEDLFVTQEVVMPSAEHWAAFGTDFGITTRVGTIAKVVDAENRSSRTGDLLVDVEAYPGFSGSPILYRDMEGHAKIVAVAAKWTYRSVPDLAPGHSGFIGCYYIQHAMTLIRKLT